ncbi:hypothetical protein OE88DRAFT_1236174 [Heliocybe sulcata]|uniref:Uncharacterized protein n=1 Tax=Heliocybe sulcata TaxID=5364 RepID=A0A5C3N864_9AGAM|nr:hypothetical protein OE88DRAFT_1236174 [Heliocybe sulcata]
MVIQLSSASALASNVEYKPARVQSPLQRQGGVSFLVASSSGTLFLSLICSRNAEAEDRAGPNAAILSGIIGFSFTLMFFQDKRHLASLFASRKPLKRLQPRWSIGNLNATLTVTFQSTDQDSPVFAIRWLYWINSSGAICYCIDKDGTY